MARGWESKSVEAQIEEAGSEAKGDAGARPRKESPEIRSKREGLMLQRARILQEMASARNPRYRTMLDEVLNYVEMELAGLSSR